MTISKPEILDILVTTELVKIEKNLGDKAVIERFYNSIKGCKFSKEVYFYNKDILHPLKRRKISYWKDISSSLK